MQTKQKVEAPVAVEKMILDAINKPGTISAAFQAFHNYSFNNQLLAYSQCKGRGLDVGPLTTFKNWKTLGRSVRKGERALILCMPCTYNKRDKDTGELTDEKRTFFKYVRRWFVISQTDGADVAPVDLPKWNIETALYNLKIKLLDFDMVNGNVGGYATASGDVAVSPISEHPNSTLFHEIAHVVLGHTSEGICIDCDTTRRALREVEAETVALCLCEINGLDGAEHSRGYIQGWFKRVAGNVIPEQSARKIISAVQKIMAAGKVTADKKENDLVPA